MTVREFAVFVNHRRYPVREDSDGTLKADLFGLAGWTSIYGKTSTEIVSRIRMALQDYA